LSLGLYWYWGQAQHPVGNNQELGHDLGAIRFDEESRRFTEFRVGTDGAKDPNKAKNADYLIYEMEVYAIADGEVIICWRNAPENSDPRTPHPARNENPPRIFGGGNFLFVRHPNGEVALYAHFKPGTIPAAICPNNDEFHADGRNDWNAAVSGTLPRVRRGDFLGNVGNAGNASGPHLHVSLHASTATGWSAGGAARPIPFSSFRHKSSTLTHDLAADWKAETSVVLPPGPIVILPSSQRPQYAPAAYVGKPWSDFLAKWQAFEKEGYRLHDFETYVAGGQRLYAGVFQPGTYTPAAYVGKPWDDFLAQWQAFEKQGYRLHDLETYVAGGQTLYAGIFQPGTYTPAAYVGKPWNDFLAQWQAFEKQNYRIHDFETYVAGGQRLYAGIFKPGTDPPAAWIGRPWDDFLMKWGQLENLNFRLEDLEVYESGGSLLYSGIFKGVREP
jgi:hypothetical protein